MNEKKSIAILGAGITGVSSAYYLSQQGNFDEIIKEALRRGASQQHCLYLSSQCRRAIFTQMIWKLECHTVLRLF